MLKIIIIITRMEYNGCFYDALSLVYNIIAKKYKIYSIRVMFYNEKNKNTKWYSPRSFHKN